MLDRAILQAWAAEMCRFLNGDDVGPQWDTFTKLPAKDRDAFFEQMRDAARKELGSALAGKTARVSYRISGVGGTLTLDKRGRPVFTARIVTSLESLVTVVLAELRTRKPRIEIRQCRREGCDNLFSRPVGRGSKTRGHPQWFCDECEVEE